MNQAIVFAGTRIESDSLADELAGWGLAVDSLHGDMKQSSRNRTLTGLRTGRTKVLVATDVAARGIDVPGISHVVNYDLPKNAEDYVHRIGRTGRAGRTGIACSLVGPRDRSVLRRIEHFLEQKLEIQTIVGLEPRRRVDSDRPRSSVGDKPRWGHKDRQQRDDRPKHFGDRDRQPRQDSGSERPRFAKPAFGDRQPRGENAGNRAPRDFGDRQPRPDDRQPRLDDRQPRIAADGEFQRRDFMERTGLERKPRSGGEGYAQRKPRSEGFAQQKPRSEGYAQQKPRSEGGYGERRSFGSDTRGPAAARSEGPRRDAAKPDVRVVKARPRRDFGDDRRPAHSDDFGNR